MGVPRHREVNAAKGIPRSAGARRGGGETRRGQQPRSRRSSARQSPRSRRRRQGRGDWLLRRPCAISDRRGPAQRGAPAARPAPRSTEQTGRSFPSCSSSPAVVLDLEDAQAPEDVKVPTIVRRRDGRPTRSTFRHPMGSPEARFDRGRKLRAGSRSMVCARAWATRGRPRFQRTKRYRRRARPRNRQRAAVTIEAAREKGARRVFKALERRR